MYRFTALDWLLLATLPAVGWLMCYKEDLFGIAIAFYGMGVGTMRAMDCLAARYVRKTYAECPTRTMKSVEKVIRDE
jgi:hypothetical protein